MSTNGQDFPSRTYILEFLETRASNPPTTLEIIQYVTKRDASCKDKVAIVLRKLEQDGLIKKIISPSKKGFTWKLIRTSPSPPLKK